MPYIKWEPWPSNERITVFLFQQQKEEMMMRTTFLKPVSVIHPLLDTAYVALTSPKTVQDLYKCFPLNRN